MKGIRRRHCRGNKCEKETANGGGLCNRCLKNGNVASVKQQRRPGVLRAERTVKR